MDALQLELCNWILVYNGVFSNLIGEDRAEALRVIEDDDAFDRWRVAFEKKNSGTRTGDSAAAAAARQKAAREWKP